MDFNQINNEGLFHILINKSKYHTKQKEEIWYVLKSRMTPEVYKKIREEAKEYFEVQKQIDGNNNCVTNTKRLKQCFYLCSIICIVGIIIFVFNRIIQFY